MTDNNTIADHTLPVRTHWRGVAFRTIGTIAAGLVVTLVTLLPGEVAAVTPVQVAKLVADDAAAEDWFGYAVALSGDTALIGAYQDDDAGTNSGSAYIFVRSATGWVQQAKLTPSDAFAYYHFGYAVAIDGDTAVIGAQVAQPAPPYTYVQAAYVFVRTGTTWVQQARLVSGVTSYVDWFGSSLAIEGDTLLAGAYLDRTNGIEGGAAYVFTRSGSVWSQQAKLVPSDGHASMRFGQSVGLDGSTAIVGAFMDDDLGTDAGAAYIFTRASGTWSQQAKLKPGDGSTYDYFGESVAVSGESALIGSRLDDDAGGNSGSAYLFRRSGSSWSQEAKLTASDAVGNQQFGASVSIDGDRAAVGALIPGAIYLFEDGGGAWVQTAKLTASTGGLGASVAQDGIRLLAGGFTDSATATRAGAAFVFAPPDALAPSVSGVYADANPAPINAVVVLSGTIDDGAAGGSNVTAAEYRVDAGAWIAMDVLDAAEGGSFDSPTEAVTASMQFAESGIYDVCVRGTDGVGNTSDPNADYENSCVQVVVYDPNGSFVTGGGWILSPTGACRDSTLCNLVEGKAAFGFVSRYLKGATRPSGSTEFNFSAGGLNFHSDSYDWLVVTNSGTTAQYKGSGTINGTASPSGQEYRFMLWGGDAKSIGADTFRIRIWFEDAGSEAVVYDNGMMQAIGGGNIIVHTK